MEKMLEVAWQVYQNHDSQRERSMGRTIASAMVAALQANGNPSNMKNTEQRRSVGRLGARNGIRNPPSPRNVALADQCAYCQEHGHWKQDCPKLRKGAGPPLTIANMEDQ